MSKDYYTILGVEKNASKEEIKKAYKKLARKYHPDVSKEVDAEQKFKDVNEAAGVLLDDKKKQQYDTYGSADGPQGFGGGGFNPGDFGINIDDIFEQFGFGGFGGSSRSSRRQQKDTRVSADAYISLEDVYFGVEKEITILRDDICEVCSGFGSKNPKDTHTCSTCSGSGVVIETQRSILGSIRTQRTCHVCHGTGKEIKDPCISCSGEGTKSKKDKITVKIPKGVESGVTLRVQKKGSYDTNTKSYGDLYLRIHITQDKEYDVDGVDLYKKIEINFIQAIIGDEIEFKHFDKVLSVKIPSGTQPGSVLRLKEKGLPYFNYNSKGDLYIKVNIEIPTKTTQKQKEILHDYAKTLKDKGLIDRLKGFFK